MKKVVLITGGSRGIGAATAIAFAKKGYNVAINYNKSEKEANELIEKLKKEYGIKAIALKANISNEYDVRCMVYAVNEYFGRIDVLVNNAAIAIDTTFEDKKKTNFMKTLEVNLVGAFLVSREVGNFMLKQKIGRIINVSSTNGIDTEYVYSLDYDASKAGLISLTKNLANYYAPYINVNAVAPGWVNTDMNSELDEEFIETEEKKILLKRFAEPEEIADVIAFLASDEAKYINGTVIRVDGGVNNG